MKTRYISLALLCTLASSAIAQETYENAQIATEDLNGTARYVGMGGAMEALGADISTIGTNPAGLGMFRRDAISASFGLTVHPQSISSNNGYMGRTDGKTVMNFDQMGVVFNLDESRTSYVNIGFNYHKSRNFNEILSAANALHGASQNKGAYIKGYRNSTYNGGYYIGTNKYYEYIGYDNDKKDDTSLNFSQTDYMLWNAFIVDPDTYEHSYNDAVGYDYSSNTKGYIGEYDINISGNSNDRIFWGFTVGIKDVNYEKRSIYTETILDGNLFTTDQRSITGTGYNLVGGVIIRPIEYSPFRFGISISTPTWYELKSSNYTYMNNNTSAGMYDNGKSNESYSFKVFTPWKFGLSLGHTIDEVLALGLSYEYSDYSSIDNRNITDEYYDRCSDTYTTSSASDYNMNENTKFSLKGVSTLKLGFEGKLTSDFAVRAGYNYVSPIYNKDGVRSTTINADACYYASTTDYINWDSTNRFTCGIGYTINDFNIDLAYQYSSKKGVFHPFEDIVEGSLSNYATTTDVKDERHQVLLTLGYRF